MIELRDREDKVLFGIIAALITIAVIVIVVGVGASIITAAAEKECLRHGWPYSTVDIGLNRYCGRQGMYGESIVRPLDWVKEHCQQGVCSE